MNGTLFGPPSSYGPGTTLEFVATFGAAQYQQVGFSDDFASTWIIFSTGATTTDLIARTNPGADTVIPGSWLGTPHRFRIDWNASSVDYYVDDAVMVTHLFALAGNSCR